jgi:L,D-peptidoglycan transpeptidase YkuD (ErfK/YbiS/YcfS/YnhG family)
VRGAGSCVFLHIWKGLGKGTAGCTATTSDTVEETIRWLDVSSHPVLVQLPESEYLRLRSAWSIP